MCYHFFWFEFLLCQSSFSDSLWSSSRVTFLIFSILQMWRYSYWYWRIYKLFKPNQLYLNGALLSSKLYKTLFHCLSHNPLATVEKRSTEMANICGEFQHDSAKVPADKRVESNSMKVIRGINNLGSDIKRTLGRTNWKWDCCISCVLKF